MIDLVLILGAYDFVFTTFICRLKTNMKYFQEAGLNTSGETENDIPKFITDCNDCTNYVRGKFLGKVRDYLAILTF